VAGLVLLAGFIRIFTTQHEVGSRFRTAVVSRLSLLAVAAVSYLALILGFLGGYDHTEAGYVANPESINAFAPRYMDWSVTVPLLAVELLAVCTVAGAVARRTQVLAVGFAFLMVFTGFLGMFVVGDGKSVASLLSWGAVSAIFWIATSVVLIGAVRHSLPQLTPEASMLLRRATIVLLGGWIIYPVVYLMPLLGASGGATTTIQVTLCAADVVIKVGVGGLIHRVAKLRTAEDVRAGDDMHPESIWISSEKKSDAGQPREVYLAAGASAHQRRARPPMTFATSADDVSDEERRERDMDEI
jgi:bacteriorhodopsin